MREDCMKEKLIALLIFFLYLPLYCGKFEVPALTDLCIVACEKNIKNGAYIDNIKKLPTDLLEKFSSLYIKSCNLILKNCTFISPNHRKFIVKKFKKLDRKSDVYLLEQNSKQTYKEKLLVQNSLSYDYIFSPSGRVCVSKEALRKAYPEAEEERGYVVSFIYEFKMRETTHGTVIMTHEERSNRDPRYFFLDEKHLLICPDFPYCSTAKIIDIDKKEINSLDNFMGGYPWNYPVPAIYPAFDKDHIIIRKNGIIDFFESVIGIFDIVNNILVSSCNINNYYDRSDYCVHSSGLVGYVDGAAGKKIHIVSLNNKEMPITLENIDIVDKVAFSPCGTFLAFCGDDESIGIWEWQKNKIYKQLIKKKSQQTDHRSLDAWADLSWHDNTIIAQHHDNNCYKITVTTLDNLLKENTRKRKREEIA